MRETWGDNTLVTLLDNENAICGIKYNGASYYFLKNLQGDIVAITNNNGNVVARYSYDAWGVCTINDSTSVGIATINPFRYRGYYYDAEIGMYYLQSRYYDPVVGRFVNADEAYNLDSVIVTLENNLCRYCRNNPLSYVDYSGYDADYIRNQNDAPYGNMKLAGNYTVGQMGGGAVALYNVLHAYSKNVNFKSMLWKLLRMPTSIGTSYHSLSTVFYVINRVYNALGRMGVSVFSIISYLQTKFWSVSCLWGPFTNLWGITAETCGAVIIAYWRKTGGHFVACINTWQVGQAGGHYRLYNQPGFEPEKTYSIRDFIKWIKDKGYTPLCMVGVRFKKGWW